MIKANSIKKRENGNIDWYITTRDNKNCYLINCTKKELNGFLLHNDFEEETYDVFYYRSDEYWMYIMGENYDVSFNYNKK